MFGLTCTAVVGTGAGVWWLLLTGSSSVKIKISITSLQSSDQHLYALTGTVQLINKYLYTSKHCAMRLIWHLLKKVTGTDLEHRAWIRLSYDMTSIVNKL